MGRLIPAGTGMKHYRNVEIAFDPTQNRKQEDEFDEMGDMIRGGFDLPMPAALADTDEGYDEAEETLDETSLEEEEVFDDTLQPGTVEIEDDEL